MELKVRQIREGLHPSEVVIEVDTVDGPRKLIVSRSSIIENCIEIGMIRSLDGKVLVELPRELQTGEWRVWVNNSQVSSRERAHA